MLEWQIHIQTRAQEMSFRAFTSKYGLPDNLTFFYENIWPQVEVQVMKAVKKACKSSSSKGRTFSKFLCGETELPSVLQTLYHARIPSILPLAIPMAQGKPIPPWSSLSHPWEKNMKR